MNWEYIAGFFDGEGCVGLFCGSAKERKYWRISITQKALPVLQAILDFVGYGTIYKSNQTYKSSRIVMWQYQIFRQREVFYFLSNILPSLILKKAECKKALYSLQEDLLSPNKRFLPLGERQ